MKILLCVVLYNISIEKSLTLNSIDNYIKENKKFNNDVKICAFDNSNEVHVCNYTYINYHFNNGKNLGLAKNYNKALDICVNEGYEFLVTLDQDTNLSKEYLDLIFNGELDKNHIAFVPILLDSNDKQISPARHIKRYKKLEKEVYAINSCSIYNVDLFKKSLVCFNEMYPLDALDLWIYNEINKNGHQVQILNVKMCHNLSISSNDFVSLTRYSNILKSQFLFYSVDCPTKTYYHYKLLLIAMVFSDILKLRFKYIPITLKYIFKLRKRKKK